MRRQVVTAAFPLDDSLLSLPLDTSLLINLMSASFLYYMEGKILSLKDSAEKISEDQHLQGSLSFSKLALLSN